MAKPISEGRDSSPLPSCPVVAIGASIHHLDALHDFLAHLTPQSGATFVLLMDYTETQAPSLPQDIKSSSDMPVTLIHEGMKLQPNHVHVIPPACLLRMDKGRLHLEYPAQSPLPQKPIGHFLRSLAEENLSHTVTVILPGTGSDGTLGIRAIKEQGGLTLVMNDNGSSEVDLPVAVMADWVLPAVKLAEKLGELLLLLGRNPLRAEPVMDHANLEAVLNLLHRRHSHDFSCYKPKTLLRRIGRRMVIRECALIEEYLDVLRSSEQEVDALFHDLLIGVTRFFRDEEALACLQEKVITGFLRNRMPHQQLRVWVAGCATGEEAYSLAILLTETLENTDKQIPVQIFATDLHPEAVAFARAGLYPPGIARDLTPERLERFFIAEDNGFRAREELREKILFAHHNLLKDPPFSRLDLISCRNLMIYLEPQTQQKLLSNFHHALRSDGYLFLGASEHLGEAAAYYATVDKKWRLFRKKDTLVPREQRFALSAPWGIKAQKLAPETNHSTANSLGSLAEKKLLRDYAPAAVVVNRDLDVVHFPSGTGEFLTPPIGVASFNLIRMACEDLQPALRSVTFKAFKDRKKTSYASLTVQHGGRLRRLNIIADPFATSIQGEDLLLVVIQEDSAPSDSGQMTAQPTGAQPPVQDKNLLIQHLEEELKNKSESLINAVREYEANHDELMSINEELHSANEELETSREELQALNEELVTVNAEVQTKNEELARTSSDLSNLIKSAHIATIFLDKEGRIRRFTPAAGDIFNLIESDLGRPFHHISGKLDTRSILEGATAVLRKLNVHEQELTTADGQCFLLRIFPYRTLQDVIEGVVMSFVDISLRKAAEEDRERQRNIAEARAQEAEEARRVLQAIIDHVPMGLGVADRNADLVMVSRFGLELMGLSMEQVQQGSVLDYPKMWGMYHLDGERMARPEELPLMRAIRKGEVTIAEEWLLRRADGEQIVVAVHAAPIRSGAGSIAGAVVAWSDITEARLQKTALEESERRLKVVIDNLPAMVFAADDGGQILFWNKECERVTGYLAEDVVGNPMAPERLFADADNRRRWQQVVCNGDTPIEDVELVIRCKNGVRKTILWSNGACTCAIPGWAIWGSGIDITERKETEKALRDARLAAENASRAKSDFLANVSHEVRTPLTIITGAQELLSETSLAPDQRQYLDMAQSSAETLLRLIEDLLDFSRIEARRMELEESPFNLLDTVETTLAGFAMQAAKKKLPIHLQVDPAVPRRILGDSLRMRQVLTNLLSNAVKFTETGSIDVTIGLRKDERIDAAGAMLFFSVRDTGIGIPAEKQSLLFKSFSQLDASATRRYGGTGLGLAISQRIIHTMGGDIWVESEPGQGSEFFFTLPLRPALDSAGMPLSEPLEKPAQTAPLVATAMPQARILVAEDEAMIRHLVSTVLKRKGWEVVTATDGAEAMDRLEKGSFDLVLMDIQMPQLDGMQVTRILRRKEAEIGRRTPVIALTAHAGEDDRRRFLRAGMDGRITKPIQISEFLQTIERALGDRPDFSA